MCVSRALAGQGCRAGLVIARTCSVILVLAIGLLVLALILALVLARW